MPSQYYNIRFIWSLLLALTCSYLVSCSDDESDLPLSNFDRGDLIKSTLKSNISKQDVDLIIDLYDQPGNLKAIYSVKYYAVTYQTIDLSGKPTIASGAIFLPELAKFKGTVCLMHGTETLRKKTASLDVFSSSESVAALVLASQGFAAIVPDYLGFGESNLVHPYIIADGYVDSSIDMLRTAKMIDSKIDYLRLPFFIAGYSEGGYGAYALHKGIETKYPYEFSITASCPMAGPYDLETTFEVMLNGKFPANSVYLSYIINAYNHYYNWNRLDYIFKYPYNKLIPQLFDGSNSFIDILVELPFRYENLLTSNYLEELYLNNNELTRKAILNNTLKNWVPIAPVLFIHGDADVDVPVESTLNIYDYLVSMGKNNVREIIYPGLDHYDAGVVAYSSAIEYFNSFIK